MKKEKEKLLVWLNAGCTSPDKREAEIEEMLLDAFLLRKGNGLKGEAASEKVNLIYCRTPVYRLTRNGRFISFEPHIDANGRVSWEQDRPTKQYFWQGGNLYGLDGKKVGSLITANTENREWILVTTDGKKKRLGKDYIAAKQAAIEAME